MIEMLTSAKKRGMRLCFEFCYQILPPLAESCRLYQYVCNATMLAKVGIR